MQLTLDMPDEINALRSELLRRLFSRLKKGLESCTSADLWSSVEDIQAWADEALMAKKKLEMAATIEELNQLAHELGLTEEFMLPDELE